MFYSFYPRDRIVDFPVIVEFKQTTQNKTTRRSLVTEFVEKHLSIDLDSYYDLLEHATIESATAIDRGCEHCTLANGQFIYKEKQGMGNFLHLNFQEYMQKGACDINGVFHKTALIVEENIFDNFLQSKGVQTEHLVPPVKPAGFDGTKCRECGGAKYMAEPDGIINDGMLTCYLCKERLKSYRMWPYNKEGTKCHN